MPKVSVAELRTHILYIRKAIDRVEDNVREHNKKIDRIEIAANNLETEMTNHLKHHAEEKKMRRWRWGIIIGVIGIFTATINIAIKLILG